MKGNCDYMFGQRLKETRLKIGITQKELAQKVGIDPAEISQYEAGKRTPKWETFNKVLDILGVTADYMMGREVTAISDDEEYKVRISKNDLQILAIIKNYPQLYKKILEEPERKIKYIDSILPK